MAGPASAQSGTEVIHSYEVDIEILDTGDLVVTERIDYDFGSALRHGIFRTIPTRYYLDEVNDRVYRIEDVAVQSPTAPADVDVSSEGAFTKIRVGDPDVEISGRHRYTLTYRVEGVLNPFTDHDELYWNAIGDEWQAPIDGVEVTVRAPADIERATCFQGYDGSHGGVRAGTGAGFDRPVPGRADPPAVRRPHGRRRDPEGGGPRARA